VKYIVYFLSSYNIHWNYGLLPQTWEDPSLANHEVEGAFGDNDPGIPLLMSNGCSLQPCPLCYLNIFVINMTAIKRA